MGSSGLRLSSSRRLRPSTGKAASIREPQACTRHRPRKRPMLLRIIRIVIILICRRCTKWINKYPFQMYFFKKHLSRVRIIRTFRLTRQSNRNNWCKTVRTKDGVGHKPQRFREPLAKNSWMLMPSIE